MFQIKAVAFREIINNKKNRVVSSWDAEMQEHGSWDPIINIDAGLAYLSMLKVQAERKGLKNPLTVAIKSYNAGFEGYTGGKYFKSGELYGKWVLEKYSKYQKIDFEDYVLELKKKYGYLFA